MELPIWRWSLSLILTKVVVTKNVMLVVMVFLVSQVTKDIASGGSGGGQGCTNRCSLAAGLRGNGERMRK